MLRPRVSLQVARIPFTCCGSFVHKVALSWHAHRNSHLPFTKDEAKEFVHEVDERFHVVSPLQSVSGAAVEAVETAVEAVVDAHIVPALIDIEERKLKLIDRKNSVAVTAVVNCEELESPEIDSDADADTNISEDELPEDILETYMESN